MIFDISSLIPNYKGVIFVRYQGSHFFPLAKTKNAMGLKNQREIEQWLRELIFRENKRDTSKDFFTGETMIASKHWHCGNWNCLIGRGHMHVCL